MGFPQKSSGISMWLANWTNLDLPKYNLSPDYKMILLDTESFQFNPSSSSNDNNNNLSINTKIRRKTRTSI